MPQKGLKAFIEPFEAPQRSDACNIIKKETPKQVFSCEFREISKNTFSHRTPPVAASELPQGLRYWETYVTFPVFSLTY